MSSDEKKEKDRTKIIEENLEKIRYFFEKKFEGEINKIEEMESKVSELDSEIDELNKNEEMLKKITGMNAFTLQPSAGAQGEFVGLLLMKKYHGINENKKKTILIPESAHGTNPASVILAGYEPWVEAG